ncbi:lipoprotein [Streptomyces longisporoflavus]|uniref:SurA N-terminal domain-containing protein n=1 Tax=Streptomyces longisporoflavus TaxID=28044 RepID=UPI00167E4BD2|nr:SurA N-terminal domain-containing protein [Streptomyces longisporoflavus]GGV52636.1 lipoprotein [Streptomyces longisporoflavus]
MHRRRRTALVLSAAAVAAAPLLTACGSEAHPGAAAVVGDERITVSQLESRVNEVRDAQRAAIPDEQQYEQAIAKTGGLTRSTLHTMVLDKVLHRAAADAGVSVSRREIQTLRAGLEQQQGGKKAFEQGWLQQYSVAPSRLNDSLRTEIEAQKLAKKLGADMNAPEGQAIFWKALSKASRKMDVDLNPRYGKWDVKKSQRADAKTPWVREVSADASAKPQQA